MSSQTENALNQHTASFRKKAATLGHDVESLSSIGKEIAGDAVDLVQEKTAQYYDQGMKQAVKMEKSLEKRIREHPLMSLLIATGIGLFAGTVWRRR